DYFCQSADGNFNWVF
nr:immunoglobulin light chain junction region [Macaca mulatta]MOX33205.1 immunoglobulin light chain junction region [Macaca mulatta]MOX33256.1 immunoglobulin light chain junction region [Macaca mulatta]MOX33297.1 immunoglobulin light chain junction region [Macaca mulatta]MOX33340.1 immunoglobulin light chain junction region [Macaca mulatta]